MRKVTTLKELLNRTGPSLGTMVQIDSEVIIDMIGMAGFDWVLIDMEHTLMEVSHIASMNRAAEAVGLATIVRPTAINEIAVSRILDVGVESLLFPRVSTADEARAAVATTRLPPAGVRGACPETRSGAYTLMPSDEFTRRANEVTVGLLIETKDALANLDEILAVEGIDFAMLGPVDMAYELGVTPDSPEIQAAWDAVEQAGDRHDVEIIGLIGRDAASEKFDSSRSPRGRKLYWCSMDTIIVSHAFAQIQDDARRGLTPT